MKGLGLFRKFVIGTVFICGVIAPFNREILQMLAMAVICTGGISLIVIVPAFGLVGWMVEAIFITVLEKCRGFVPERAAVPPPIPPSRRSLALAGYLRDASRAGMTDAEVLELLGKQGWSEEEIREARQHV